MDEKTLKNRVQELEKQLSALQQSIEIIYNLSKENKEKTNLLKQVNKKGEDRSWLEILEEAIVKADSEGEDIRRILSEKDENEEEDTITEQEDEPEEESDEEDEL